jgi:hypothetical protein
MLSREQLQRMAADSGFPIESYEKVHVLVRLLEAVRAHPFLGSRMALKGGTAINLFVLDLPRLSVDIDLNYVGASDRDTMLAERPRVEQTIQQITGRMGLTVMRAPGRPRRRQVAAGVHHSTRTADQHRGRRQLHAANASVVPGFQRLSSDRRGPDHPDPLFPFEAHELEFLERLNSAGDIAPELLTPDADMQTLIRDHPGLKWKALNRKKRLGIAAAHEPSE